MFTPRSRTETSRLEVLKSLVLTNVYVVKDRAADGDFPTVSYPNRKQMGLHSGLKCQRDRRRSGSGHDPPPYPPLYLPPPPQDADRLGVRVKNKDGGYTRLHRKMAGCLLEE